MTQYLDLMKEKAHEAISVVYDYRNRHPNDTNLAVVFDIDGTLLNEDTPIVPIIEFYNYCKELGYHIFIITARDSYGIAETSKQLLDMGITDYVSIYFRLPTYWDMNKYKESCRESIMNKGYKTVLSIGDTDWDIGTYGGYGVLLPHIAF